MGHLRGELYVMFCLVYLCLNNYIAEPPLNRFIGDNDIDGSSNLKYATTVTLDPDDVTGDLEVPKLQFGILNTVEKTTVEINEVKIIEPVSIENYSTYNSVAASLLSLNSPNNKVKGTFQPMTVDLTKLKNESTTIRIHTESPSSELQVAVVVQQIFSMGDVTLYSENVDRWINTDGLQKSSAASLQAKWRRSRRSSA